mgnify:CR=1 FL=1
MEIKLVFKLDEKEITMTEGEARGLYLKLHELFGSRVDITYPVHTWYPLAKWTVYSETSGWGEYELKEG